MVGKVKKIISLLIALYTVFIFSAPVMAAQNTDFRLEMDSLNLQKGASSTMVISLINAQGAQVVSIEGLDGFDILSQSSSTSTSTVNNVTTYQSDIYFSVMPKITGEFTIKANISFDGKNYETNSLTVNITEGGVNSGVPDLFVETVLSHNEAYLGEKIILSYEVYSKENVDGLGFTDYLTIDGAVVKEQPDYQITYETLYIDGEKYTKYTVAQLIIDPIKTGVCIIPSFNLQVKVISGEGRGGFSSFFQTTTAKYLQTEEAEIQIKSLPVVGRPDNFSGIVGELNISGSYSRNELNYGDSLALQVEIWGDCNLDGVKNIFGGEVADFTVYENQKNSTESIEDNAYYAEKTIEAILVPERNGEIDAPPVSISYFNPVTGQYETAKIPAETINVLGDMPTVNMAGGSQLPAVSYETVLISQVNYDIPAEGYYSLRIQKDLTVGVFVGVLIVGIISSIAIFILLKMRNKNTPLKIMYKELLKTQDINSAYNCFNAMMKHCFGVNLKANSKSGVMSSLPDSDLALQVAGIMDYMESEQIHKETSLEDLKKKIINLYKSKLGKRYA